MIVLSHPTGNRNVRAVLSSLSQAGLLAKFQTTIAADSHAVWLRLLPKNAREEWLRRVYPIARESISTRPWLELTRMILCKMGLARFVEKEHSWAGINSVYQDLDRATAHSLGRMVKKHRLTGVYAYEDGALCTFMMAKKLGLTCVYDLPIAFWETVRKLLGEEAERLPHWSKTLGGGIHDSTRKLERKTRELELADIIVAPGQFVKDSLPYWARHKTVVTSPFGSPATAMEAKQNAKPGKTKSNRRLRVLFAGSMGQRKGLGDLFAAMRLLNNDANIELVVMGSMLAPVEFYRSELPRFTYMAGRPHEKVLELMRSCDVLCLPSIVEGRALVMQEAMSNGLPIIITSNTGGEDLVKDGCTGFLVPIRSPEAIAQKINWFLEHRSQIPEMGRMARDHAARYSWDAYGSTIVGALS